MQTPEMPSSTLINHLLEEMSPQVRGSLRLSGPLSWEVRGVTQHSFSYIADVSVMSGGKTQPLVMKICKEESGSLDLKTPEERAVKYFQQLSRLLNYLDPKDGFAVPEPVACFGRAILMQRAPGIQLYHIWSLRQRERLRSFSAAGTWLKKISCIPLGNAPSGLELLESEASDVFGNLEHCRSLALLREREYVLAAAFWERLTALLRGAIKQEDVITCHCDFNLANIFWTPDCLTVVDLDDTRPAFWPRDLVCMLSYLTVKRMTSLVGWRFASACFETFLEGRGYTPAVITNDLFTFYWFREIVACLRNSNRSGPVPRIDQYKALLISRLELVSKMG